MPESESEWTPIWPTKQEQDKALLPFIVKPALRFAVYDKRTDELLAMFFDQDMRSDFMLMLLEHKRETYSVTLVMP